MYVCTREECVGAFLGHLVQDMDKPRRCGASGDIGTSGIVYELDSTRCGMSASDLGSSLQVLLRRRDYCDFGGTEL